ncbi:MAG: hypothetical protein Kow0063_16120 [Anaerolineae bacterium]
MEQNLARRLIEAVMPRDKRQAVPAIRALIDEVEAHLQHYEGQAEEVRLRNPTELLQARKKIAEAMELSEMFELTVIGERVREIERHTLDALNLWGDQRRQMIDTMLASGEDALPPEFNQWVEEYRLCFPDKEIQVTGWRRQKSVVEIPGRFEQDYQEAKARVARLQDEARALYEVDPVNNEGSAIGKMRLAYEEARRLADNYATEQAARDLATEARNLYEKRKEAWSKSLVTSARFAQFERVRKQWEQAKRAGEEKVIPYEAVLDEEGDLVFGVEEGEEILTLIEGEPISIDDALSRLSDIEFIYADTKTGQYIRLADSQAETNPKGAIDTLKEFKAQYTDVLRETHKKRLELKIQEYQIRLNRREKARDMLEKARTEANAIEAWRAVLKAEDMDDGIPGLQDVKAEIGRQLRVVIEEEVLPEYQQIGIFEDRGAEGWDNRIAFLTDLQSLLAGYQPLGRFYDELGSIIKDLIDFRDLDMEIRQNLPGIQARLREAPHEADEELEAIEYKLIKLQRVPLYPAVQKTRQLVNAHLNLRAQKRVWLAEIDDENKLTQNLAAIETAVSEFAHLEDGELNRIHKRYQARAMLTALETDKDYGVLSEGLQTELETIDAIGRLLQEANEPDQELIRRVNSLSRWLTQKRHDYEKIVKQLDPLQEKIEARDFAAADSLLDILFGLYPNDPTLVQRKNRMEVEWKIHLMEKLTREAADLDRVRTRLEVARLRGILNDLDKLQELAGESVVQRFQELRAHCYLGLARAEPRQRRYWLDEAERVAPEASTAYGYVVAELNELQKQDDLDALAHEDDEHKRVLMLEQMRVRYPNDIEILELLADLYLRREEPLKAQSIAEHLKLLQRRGIAASADVAQLESKVQELIKIHEWKRSVIEQFDPDASLESLKSASHLMAEAPVQPGTPNHYELKEWFETQKRNLASALLDQAKDIRDRGADLVDVCDKMIRVWLFMPQSLEARYALDELGTYSLDLQRQLELEARDTSGRASDAQDWLNQQIKRVDSLLARAKDVSRILEIYYERGADAEERRDKSISLRQQIEALTAHKRDLSRLRSELAILQSDWREIRESGKPNDPRWDSLERRVNALQTGTGEYAPVKHLRQHEQVKHFFNQVMRSREDQRRLGALFEELGHLVDQNMNKAAIELIARIRAVEGWDTYRFEDHLKDVLKTSAPVTLASLEEVLLEREKAVIEVSQLISTHTRGLRRWRDTQGLWAVPDREALLTRSETSQVVEKLLSGQKRDVQAAVATYRRMLKEICTDHGDGHPSEEEKDTVQAAIQRSLREGKWEEAIISCWQAAFNHPQEEAKLQEQLRRLKNEANANNNPGPFVKRARELAERLVNPGNEHAASVGSWHYFLAVADRFPEILPEGSSNPRIILELAHMQMIRSDVEEWLEEASQQIRQIANLFRQFTSHYITAQQSLDKLRSMRFPMFKHREMDRIAMSGQLAFNECRRICPDYPYPRAIRERFGGY